MPLRFRSTEAVIGVVLGIALIAGIAGFSVRSGKNLLAGIPAPPVNCNPCLSYGGCASCTSLSLGCSVMEGNANQWYCGMGTAGGYTECTCPNQSSSTSSNVGGIYCRPCQMLGGCGACAALSQGCSVEEGNFTQYFCGVGTAGDYRECACPGQGQSSSSLAASSTPQATCGNGVLDPTERCEQFCDPAPGVSCKIYCPADCPALPSSSSSAPSASSLPWTACPVGSLCTKSWIGNLCVPNVDLCAPGWTPQCASDCGNAECAGQCCTCMPSIGASSSSSFTCPPDAVCYGPHTSGQNACDVLNGVNLGPCPNGICCDVSQVDPCWGCNDPVYGACHISQVSGSGCGKCATPIGLPDGAICYTTASPPSGYVACGTCPSLASSSSSSSSVSIALCGNHVPNPGEECDPPGLLCSGDATCNAQCRCEGGTCTEGMQYGSVQALTEAEEIRASWPGTGDATFFAYKKDNGDIYLSRIALTGLAISKANDVLLAAGAGGGSQANPGEAVEMFDLTAFTESDALVVYRGAGARCKAVLAHWAGNLAVGVPVNVPFSQPNGFCSGPIVVRRLAPNKAVIFWGLSQNYPKWGTAAVVVTVDLAGGTMTFGPVSQEMSYSIGTSPVGGVPRGRQMDVVVRSPTGLTLLFRSPSPIVSRWQWFARLLAWTNPDIAEYGSPSMSGVDCTVGTTVSCPIPTYGGSHIFSYNEVSGTMQGSTPLMVPGYLTGGAGVLVKGKGQGSLGRPAPEWGGTLLPGWDAARSRFYSFVPLADRFLLTADNGRNPGATNIAMGKIGAGNIAWTTLAAPPLRTKTSVQAAADERFLFFEFANATGTDRQTKVVAGRFVDDCPLCGNGTRDAGEQCGEPGLSCPSGKTCSNCLCVSASSSSGVSSSSSSSSSALSSSVSSSPHAAVCGNGLKEAAEVCDDGNVAPGDGCSATCAIEPGGRCFDVPAYRFDGQKVQFADDETTRVRTVALDDQHVLVVYRHVQPNYKAAVVGTIQNGQISFGQSVTFDASWDNPAIDIDVQRLDASRAVLSYIMYASPPTNPKCRAVVAQISGSSVTFGTPVDLVTSALGCSRPSAAVLSPSKVVFGRQSYTTLGNTTSNLAFRTLTATVTGKEITLSAPADLATGSRYYLLRALDATHVMAFGYSPLPDTLYARVGELTGGALSWGTEKQLPSIWPASNSYINSIVSLAPTRVLLIAHTGGLNGVTPIEVRLNGKEITGMHRHPVVAAPGGSLTTAGEAIALGEEIIALVRGACPNGQCQGQLQVVAAPTAGLRATPQVLFQQDNVFVGDTALQGPAFADVGQNGVFVAYTYTPRSGPDVSKDFGKATLGTRIGEVSACVPPQVCGNGTVEGFEECDTGHACVTGYACSASCLCEMIGSSSSSASSDSAPSSSASSDSSATSDSSASSDSSATSDSSSLAACTSFPWTECMVGFSTCLAVCDDGICRHLTPDCPPGWHAEYSGSCGNSTCSAECFGCVEGPGSSSSSQSSGGSSSASAASSSGQGGAVCGNFTLESTEQCEIGICCPSGASCDTRTCQCAPLSVVPAQNVVCGNFRIEGGEDCEDGISTPHLPCSGAAVCDPQTCRCPTGTAICPRWRSMP